MTNAIEQAEREIQRDKDDLKRLRKRYPGYDFVPVDPKKGADLQSHHTPRTDFTSFELAVLTAVNSNVDIEWTSRSVIESLRTAGIRLPEKEEAAMNAVGSALIELKDSDKILRSHEGKGRDPHRYCAIPAEVPAEKETTPEEITSRSTPTQPNHPSPS